MNRKALVVIAMGFALACGGPNAAPQRDATAAEYERRAEHAQRTADSYETAEAQAAGQHASQQDYPAAPVHRRAAIEQREQAAELRARAQELRAAEARACAGLTEDQPNPFSRREDIMSISIIEEPSVSVLGTADTLKTVGTRVELRARPGMTTAELQRTVDCQIARARVSGPVPGDEHTPLAVEGVDAVVSATADSFIVELRSDDPGTVQEIIRRAKALKR
jgi:hypothetical protein